MSSEVRNYHVLNQIGGGAFGTVFKAREKSSQKIVALKKVFCAWTREEGQHYQQRHVLPTPNALGGTDRRSIPPRVMREIIALKYLRMENVVQLMEIFPNGSHVILVFEYMQTNLRQVLSHYRLDCAQQKKYAHMLMLGLDYIHGVRVIHRDLKPENLLINSSGVLKVADFGLCRLMSADAAVRYENQAGTRHYRAPEVIFGSQTYDDRADIWSAGCVVYELACNKPFLWADDDIDIAVEMIHVFGLPNSTTTAQLDALKEHFPDLFKVTFELPSSPSRPLYTILSQQCDDVYVADLISLCLTFFPWQRSSAKHVLQAKAFTTAPLPAAVEELPDISALRHGRHRLAPSKSTPQAELNGYATHLVSKTSSIQKTAPVYLESSSVQSSELFSDESSLYQPARIPGNADRSDGVQGPNKFGAVSGKKPNIPASPSKFRPNYSTSSAAANTAPSYPVNDQPNRRLMSASVKAKVLPEHTILSTNSRFAHMASTNSSGQVASRNEHRPERLFSRRAKKGHMAWY